MSLRWGLLGLLLLLGTGVALQGQGPIPYDLIYVRSPRSATVLANFADVFLPFRPSPSSDLILRHPNGTEEVLDTGGAMGAIADPCVAFDAKTVFYSKLPNVVTLAPYGEIPVAGADIWKIDLATKVKTQLTHGEFTPNTSIRTTPLPYKPFNMGPCPVNTSEGHMVVFTSNRNGFMPPKGYTQTTNQLYVMREDGSNIHAIGPMTLGSALHPFQTADGTVLFSTQEDQGLRDERLWGLWSIWPDGRVWGPVVSAFNAEFAVHFAAERTDRSIVAEFYYNKTNAGFGTFLQITPPAKTALAGFYPAPVAQNPLFPYHDANNTALTTRFSFTPTGSFVLTPWSTPTDEASGIINPAFGVLSARVGKVTHPSGAPNNCLLLSWSPGPVNYLTRPTFNPPVDAGLYLSCAPGPIADSKDLLLIVNDPAYNELWPKAVVPYAGIYGVAVTEPFAFKFLPNDGTLHASLPKGTPYGLVGTSSFYKRESAPGTAMVGLTADGLNGFNSGGLPVSSNFLTQGMDTSKYSNADIATVRIVMQEPTSDPGSGPRGWYNRAGERMRVLGEIPLRKFTTGGAPILDPEGNPDTSFLAKVPADIPFTFQMLDAKGHVLSMAQTWHQVRPGEVRVDCGGCHAHSSVPLAFASTAAATLPPADLTLMPAHDVEYRRDIDPLIQRSCLSCHQGTVATAPARLAFTTDPATNYQRLAQDPNGQSGFPPLNVPFWGVPNLSRFVACFGSRRSQLQWQLEGARLDGWTNGEWPTTDTTDPRFRHLYDLDYTPGTVNHGALLSPAEQRLVATWIDLCAPIDQGGGYFKDELRPTLTAKADGAQLLLGAADAYSGLNVPSLTATLDGMPTILTSLGLGRWSVPLAPGFHALAASVRDMAGNTTSIAWTVEGATPPVPPLPPPTGLTVQTVPRPLPPAMIWTAVPGAVSYEVQVFSSGGTLVLQAIRVLGRSLALPLGQPAGQYTWRVRRCGTPVPGAPVPPTDLVCANGAPASAWATGTFSR